MSPLYSDKDIEEIRNRLSIEELVSEYLSLKRTGRYMRGLCPFHSEKTPSFYVDPEKQLYHCFGCGAGGDIFTFIMEMEKLNFSEAVEHLAQKAGVKLTVISARGTSHSDRERMFKLLEDATKLFRAFLVKTEAGKKALEYLYLRGISSDSIKKFEIGYAPDSMDSAIRQLKKLGYREKEILRAGIAVQTQRGLIDRFRGRIIFPIRDVRGRVVGFGGRLFEGKSESPKYLNSPETEFFKKGSLLYNLQSAKHSAVSKDYIIVVEGYTDVIALTQAGFPNVVATLGTALTETHLSVLSRFTKNVYLAFDSDTAGEKAAERGIDLISKAGTVALKVVIFPEGLDPADFYVRFKDDGVQERIEELIISATPIEDFVIQKRIAGFDILDPREKSAAAKEAANVISRIQDPVVRDEYIKKYARLIGVSEDTLISLLKTAPVGYEKVEKAAKNQKEDEEAEIERKLLRLLYSDYRNRVNVAVENLEPDYFFDEACRNAFKLIYKTPEAYEDSAKLIRDIRQAGGEEAVKVISGILISPQDIPEGVEPDKLFREFIYCLKERYLKREIEKVRKEILAAEKSGDFERAKELLIEIKTLTAILDDERKEKFS